MTQVRGVRVGGEFWRFTGPRALTSVIQMAMQRLDIVLVGALAGAAPAAVYAAATRFIVVGQMGNNAISMAAQPGLAVAIGQEDRAGTNDIYQTSTAWLMALTWPLYLTLILFGDTFLNVFGGGYAAGADVVLLLSVAMLVATGFGMVDMLLSMAGHTSWNLGNAVFALVVQIGVDLVLIPTHGVVGAAIGWSAAIVARNAAALIQVAVALRLHPFGVATSVSAGICLFSYGAVAAASKMVLGDGLVPTAASLAVSTTSFATCLWLFRKPLRLRALASLRGRATVSNHSGTA
jgi:O-antigen/teichoic acid export membrane protein